MQLPGVVEQLGQRVAPGRCDVVGARRAALCRQPQGFDAVIAMGELESRVVAGNRRHHFEV